MSSIPRKKRVFSSIEHSLPAPFEIGDLYGDIPIPTDDDADAPEIGPAPALQIDEPTRSRSFHACGRCNIAKRFTVGALYHGRMIRICRQCQAVCGNEPAIEGHDRDLRLRNTYNITIDDYRELLQKQGYRCAICRKPHHRDALVVDHDHATGAVRGLLCGACNTGLGMFRDDMRALERAVAYLHHPPRGKHNR